MMLNTMISLASLWLTYEMYGNFDFSEMLKAVPELVGMSKFLPPFRSPALQSRRRKTYINELYKMNNWRQPSSKCLN
jgi:hypothetical protein